jgi:hypothetical protein
LTLILSATNLTCIALQNGYLNDWQASIHRMLLDHSQKASAFLCVEDHFCKQIAAA